MTPQEKIRKFKEKYKAEIKKGLNEATKKAAERTLKEVVKRTKAGLGTNGQLKALEASTIAFRRRWAAFLAEDTSPAKSNLTATGQLLEALYYRVVGSRFFIKVNSKNRDEGLGGEELISVKVTKKKSEMKSRLTNEDVRKFVEDAGREFLALNDQEKAELEKFTANVLKESLKSILGKEV